MLLLWAPAFVLLGIVCSRLRAQGQIIGLAGVVLLGVCGCDWLGTAVSIVSFLLGTSLLPFGITGGIGAGKSTASGEFEKNGFVLIDADVVAREVWCALAAASQHSR